MLSHQGPGQPAGAPPPGRRCAGARSRRAPNSPCVTAQPAATANRPASARTRPTLVAVPTAPGSPSAARPGSADPQAVEHRLEEAQQEEDDEGAQHQQEGMDEPLAVLRKQQQQERGARGHQRELEEGNLEGPAEDLSATGRGAAPGVVRAHRRSRAAAGRRRPGPTAPGNPAASCPPSHKPRSDLAQAPQQEWRDEPPTSVSTGWRAPI